MHVWVRLFIRQWTIDRQFEISREKGQFAFKTKTSNELMGGRVKCWANNALYMLYMLYMYNNRHPKCSRLGHAVLSSLHSCAFSAIRRNGERNEMLKRHNTSPFLRVVRTAQAYT